MASGFTLGNMIRKRMALPPGFSLSFLFYQFPNSLDFDQASTSHASSGIMCDVTIETGKEPL